MKFMFLELHMVTEVRRICNSLQGKCSVYREITYRSIENIFRLQSVENKTEARYMKIYNEDVRHESTNST
jgi:hypothetical protein